MNYPPEVYLKQKTDIVIIGTQIYKYRFYCRTTFGTTLYNYTHETNKPTTAVRSTAKTTKE